MSWQSVKLQAKADILKQVHAIEPHQRFHPEGSVIDALPVPFYPEGSLLIRCRDMDWRDTGDCLWYVKIPRQEITALDGSAANIHHLNFHSGLHLTETILPSYMKFRLYFGKDDGHRRHMIEDSPLEIKATGSGYLCTCQFYEERRLYTGLFRINRRGETELLEKTLLPARLSLKPMPEFVF